MKIFSSLALVLLLSVILTAPVRSQSATECKQLECSGRHIECRNSNPIKKAQCEVDKEKWKKGCEVKKAACIAAGFVVGQ